MQQYIEIILGIIVIAIIVTIVYFYRKRHPSEKDKEWADKFLESLSDYMYKEVLEIISTTDYSQFKNITEVSAYMLERIYGTVWVYVESKLNEASENGIMPKLAISIINRKYVEAFIATILDKMNFNDKIAEAFNNPKAFDIDKMIEEDKKLSIEFENENEYFENGEAKVEDLPKTEPTDEDVLKFDRDPILKYQENPDTYQEVKQDIIPPSDEEVPLKEDDDTVESLTEEEIAAGIHFNKNGIKIDKNGRFVKMK